MLLDGAQPSLPVLGVLDLQGEHLSAGRGHGAAGRTAVRRGLGGCVAPTELQGALADSTDADAGKGDGSPVQRERRRFGGRVIIGQVAVIQSEEATGFQVAFVLLHNETLLHGERPAGGREELRAAALADGVRVAERG